MDDFALWLGCNAMTQELTSCAINTLLIYPGIFGLFSVLILYIIAVPILVWMNVRYLTKMMLDKLKNKEGA